MLRRLRLAPVIIVVAALVVALPLALAWLRVLWNVGFDNFDRTETLYYPEAKRQRRISTKSTPPREV